MALNYLDGMWLDKDNTITYANESDYCFLCHNHHMKEHNNFRTVECLLTDKDHNLYGQKVVKVKFRGLDLCICKSCIDKLHTALLSEDELLKQELDKVGDIDNG